MKKLLTSVIALGMIITSLPTASAVVDERILELKDVSTKNIKEKLSIDYRKIKALCSIDECILVENDSFEEIVEDFMREYIKDLDEETKAILKIKGINITKVILND